MQRSPEASKARRVLIIGAGHAGGAAAALLRQYGHKGAIQLIGDERVPPYHRPPLSKAWLKGDLDVDALALRPSAFYAEQGISMRLDLSALSIDVDARQVVLSNGTTASYDVLILATGARPIPLAVPGANLDGVLSLRTVEDAEQLKHAIAPGKRVAVIGGGYIGLEVAASASALGAQVLVIEREARLLARVASEPLSRFYRRYHEGKGVSFELGVSVTGFEGRGGAVSGVILSDGRVTPCDIAVVGVGVRPNDALAEAAGIETACGVVVDLRARTSVEGIYAIGDVTRRPVPLYERSLCLESVPNALEQAKQAAADIIGAPPPTPETPWQWSDQYDLKLQIAGYPFDVDRVVVRGDADNAPFAIFHLRGEIVQAVEAINAPAEFMMGRQLIGGRTPVDVQRLADAAVSMRAVVL